MNQQEGHQVTLRVRNNSDSFIGEHCYLTGSFNNWSADAYLLGTLPAKGEELCTILQHVRSGALEFKVSRGSWTTLQATPEGKLPPPFTVDVQHDLEYTVTIDAWRDEFPRSTASEQVKVLHERFYFPQLDCYRKVWIYLPKTYTQSDQAYPVLYMHDGQHLFDEATSVGRAGPVEWMVDETLDTQNAQLIVVAIDHAETYAQREEEFMLHAKPELPQAKGEAYLHDIVNALKPYVDRHYRTLPDRAHTAMSGSSLGGLISLYAGLLYPEVFGTLGILSPSIWMDREGLYRVTEERLAQSPEAFQQLAFYLYVGGREKRMDSKGRHENMARDLRDYAAYLRDEYAISVLLDTDPHGKHGAQYWQGAFKRFYLYWQENDKN